MSIPLLIAFRAVFVVLIGLCVGSFLNVCIYRLPRGGSPAKGRSRCPSCEKTIAWYDNVPLLSFIVLGGRCRHCRAAISPRYPIVEFLSALLAWATWLFHPSWPSFLFYYLALIAPLLAVIFIDLDTLTIPDGITLPGIALGLFGPILLAGAPWRTHGVQSLLGILVGGGMLFLLAFLSLRLLHKEGMGGGDVKLAAMLGAFFGPLHILWILVVAALAGLLVALLLMLRGKFRRDTPLPFGPFLALAAYAVFFLSPTFEWLWQKWSFWVVGHG